MDLGFELAPMIGKKALQAGRYHASEAMRDPKLQQKAIDFALDKAKPVVSKVGKEGLMQLSTKIRPKRKDGKQLHRTDIKEIDYGSGLADLFDPRFISQGVLIPKPFTDPKFMKSFGKAIQGHHGIMDIAKNTAKNYYGKGGAIDIHKAIGKLPKPKKGWTLPGHNYTGPYNPLDEQLKYNPNTGEILEIYQQPSGKTDAVSMQHDVDYSVCGDDKKCKNKADRKMVKALNAIPYDERQWGHFIARNAINTKQKLGLGVPKNGKSRRVKRTGKKI